MQRQNESDITLDELIEIGILIMHASVDTTSTKTARNVLQLAVNQDKQEALREEILRAVKRCWRLRTSRRSFARRIVARPSDQ